MSGDKLPRRALHKLLLPEFAELGEGQKVFIERTRTHEPSIPAGTPVVIEKIDGELVEGGVYLVQQSNGPVFWMISFEGCAKMVPPESGPCVMLHPLSSMDYWKGQSRKEGGVPFMGYTSDGPIPVDGLKEKLLGKAVGIFTGPYPTNIPVDPSTPDVLPFAALVAEDRPDLKLKRGDALFFSKEPGFTGDGIYCVVYEGKLLGWDYVKVRTKKGQMRKRIGIGGLTIETDDPNPLGWTHHRATGRSREM